MKIVIDIDDEQVLFDIKNRGLEAKSETDKVIINAIYNGTPLPKGHGRIIDESRIKHIECHTEQELYGDKIRYVKTTDAPTIIEADKCTYKKTGCGSCKRQLDCPYEAEGSDSE